MTSVLISKNKTSTVDHILRVEIRWHKYKWSKWWNGEDDHEWNMVAVVAADDDNYDDWSGNLSELEV